jgi:hypothetical protein
VRRTLYACGYRRGASFIWVAAAARPTVLAMGFNSPTWRPGHERDALSALHIKRIDTVLVRTVDAADDDATNPFGGHRYQQRDPSGQLINQKGRTMLDDDDETDSALGELSKAIRVGPTALLADLSEPGPEAIDAVIAHLNGTVLRRSFV